MRLPVRLYLLPVLGLSLQELNIVGETGRFPSISFMPTIIFENNSIEKEKQVIAFAKSSEPFFQERNLPYFLPSKNVEEEFELSSYDAFRDQLTLDWKNYKGEFFLDKLTTFFHLPADLHFRVNITQYGCYGFYHAPANDIFLNRRMTTFPVDTLKHELLHLVLEPYVLKFHLHSEQKEQLVNMIFGVLNE